MSTSYWKWFFDSAWENTPTVIPSAQISAVVPSAATFHNIAVRLHQADSRGESFSRRPRIYASNGQLFRPRRPAQNAPETVFQLFEALTRGSGSDSAYIASDIHRFSKEIYDLGRKILDPVVAAIGPPCAGSNSFLYFGDYQVSPAGVHKDAASTFNLVISGQKIFVTWPYNHFVSQVDRATRFGSTRLGRTVDSDTLAAGRFFRVQAGDAMYLPSNGWHLALGEHGIFSATVNFSYFHGPQRFQSARLLDRLSKRIGPDETVASPDRESILPPKYKHTCLDAVQSILDAVREDVLRAELEAMQIEDRARGYFVGPLSWMSTSDSPPPLS
jgi:hypothetical protein